MKLTLFEIILFILGGAGISMGAGMFKDFLKKVLPKSAAYIVGVIFLLCAATSVFFNYKKQRDEEKRVDTTTVETKTQPVLQGINTDSALKQHNDSPVIKIPDTPVVKKKDWVLIKKQGLKMSENVSRTLPEGPRFSFKSYTDNIYVNFFFPGYDTEYKQIKLTAGEEYNFFAEGFDYGYKIIYIRHVGMGSNYEYVSEIQLETYQYK